MSHPRHREPRWRAFLRQFKDLLIVILLVAAVVSLIVTREWETPVVIAAVVLLNAIIGFVQESRAEASLEALKKMLVTTASVRRDGRMMSLDAADLVVGDVVTVEAGDRVPADGRLLASASLEVQESTLTDEAQPVSKSATAEVDPGAALGDRVTAVLMGTTVTRGRGEVVVTATGMHTETGRIAHMLHDAKPVPTPLQGQIAGLSRTLAIIIDVATLRQERPRLREVPFDSAYGRRCPRSVRAGQRHPGRAGHAGARGGGAGRHARRPRRCRGPQGPAPPSRPDRARGHRRPTPPRGAARDQAVPRRRHPGPDDHR